MSIDSIQVDSMLNNSPAIIENGAILIGVRDYNETYDRIRDLVEEYDAQIENEEERTTDFRLENTLVIRIDPLKFKSLMAALRELSVVVREKRLWKQDLESQFVDLKARLDSKFEAKKRLEQFMKSAKKAEDVLPVQRELDVVTEEIEAITKTAKSLTQKTIYSTVTATFYQEVIESTTQDASFGDRFVEGAKTGWINFKEFLILSAHNWPYIAIGMIFFFVIVLALQSNRRRSRQFKIKAMQAQQQWLLQQQKGTGTNPKQPKDSTVKTM